MVRVKLCGMTNADDRDAAVAAGADAVGFIVDVDVDSPREIPAERAATLVDGLPPFVSGVLVTMPGSVQDVLAVQRVVGADVIQIHSTLTPEQIGALRRRADESVVAAVGPDADLDAYADAADAVLVDSVDTDGGGGTGRTQDWEQTRAAVADVDVPVVLAGGLTPDNVAEAADVVDPFAVDTASGVESTGGRKDHELMRQFVAAATLTEREPKR
jgi:phosphoribosylanthranilate isomerase